MKSKARGVFRCADGTYKVDVQFKAKGSRKRIHIERRGYASEAAAEKAVSSVKAEAQERFDGRYEERGFDFLMDSFLAYERTRKRVSSFYADMTVYKNHVIPRWKGKTIVQAFCERSVSDFRSYIDKLPVKTGRKNRIIRRFMALAAFARARGLIGDADYSRAEAGLSLFRNDGEETRPDKIALTKDEYRLFIGTFADDDEYKAVFELWFFLGARTGEIMGLKWEDLDERTKEVYIHQQRQWNKDEGKWETVQTKTASSRRHLKLSDFVFSEMMDLKSSRPTDPGDWMFFAGRPVSKHPLVLRLKAHCEEAGVPAISPHEIRHTVASWLVEASTDMSDLIAVSQWLGHSSTKETLDTYSHYLKKKSSIYSALDVR